MRFEFHPEALEEYHQASLWYAQREQNVALQFVTAIEKPFSALLMLQHGGEL